MPNMSEYFHLQGASPHFINAEGWQRTLHNIDEGRIYFSRTRRPFNAEGYIPPHDKAALPGSGYVSGGGRVLVEASDSEPVQLTPMPDPEQQAAERAATAEQREQSRRVEKVRRDRGRWRARMRRRAAQ